MAGILSALGRGNQKKDPMRESAALTTVYLLEQNQKFEQFMRQKVDELESRVAAQQARLSTREIETWSGQENQPRRLHIDLTRFLFLLTGIPLLLSAVGVL